MPHNMHRAQAGKYLREAAAHFRTGNPGMAEWDLTTAEGFLTDAGLLSLAAEARLIRTFPTARERAAAADLAARSAQPDFYL